jgi:hypothetical protein
MKLVTRTSMAAVLAGVALSVLTAGAIAGLTPNVQTSSMTGASEVPGPGDPNGSGSTEVDLRPRKGEVCWQLLWSNVSPVTAAHIHKGKAGESGPVKILFFEFPPGDMGSGASGCTDVPKLLQKRIAAAPGRYYANFHTTEFGDGAIRGQLTRP